MGRLRRKGGVVRQETRQETLTAAQAETSKGIDVCYLCADYAEAAVTKQEAQKLFPDAKAKALELEFETGRMIFLGVTSDPATITGFRGKVMFDPDAFKYGTLRLWLRERGWRQMADGCNARHPA